MKQIVPPADEAVLEVELSSQELQALTQKSAPQPDTRKTAADQSRCLPCVTAGAGAASIVAVAAILFMHRSPQIEQPAVVAAPVSAPSPVVAAAAPPPPRPAAAVAAPVKFANPFDRSEVFEFPAGTSRAQAREKVAQILFERGQERHPKLRRVASIHRGA